MIHTGRKSDARWRSVAQLLTIFTSPRAEGISGGIPKGIKPSSSYCKNIAIKQGMSILPHPLAMRGLKFLGFLANPLAACRRPRGQRTTASTGCKTPGSGVHGHWAMRRASSPWSQWATGHILCNMAALYTKQGAVKLTKMLVKSTHRAHRLPQQTRISRRTAQASEVKVIHSVIVWLFYYVYRCGQRQ